MTASLPMYPLGGLRAATERLWERIARAAGSTTRLEPWERDAMELWTESGLDLTQTCGWPLITSLAGRVRVLGSFSYRTPDWSGDTYRSVVVGRRGTSLSEVAGGVAAVNGPDSLSGWVSLVWAVAGPGGTWPGTVRWTGAHLRSLAEVAAGRADVASIDAVTLAYVRRHRPELAEHLAVLGAGPPVPTLPLVTRADAGDDEVERWRRALGAAVDQRVTDELLIDGFTRREVADYLVLADLAPATVAP